MKNFSTIRVQLLDEDAENNCSNPVKTTRIFKVSLDKKSFAVKAMICKTCSAQNTILFDMNTNHKVGCTVCGQAICSTNLRKELACLEKIKTPCVVQNISDEYIHQMFHMLFDTIHCLQHQSQHQ